MEYKLLACRRVAGGNPEDCGTSAFSEQERRVEKSPWQLALPKTRRSCSSSAVRNSQWNVLMRRHNARQFAAWVRSAAAGRKVFGMFLEHRCATL